MALTEPLRKWVAGEVEISPLWRATEILEKAEKAIRRVAAAIVASRSPDDMKVAFISEFWVADQKQTGVELPVNAQADDLGVDEQKVLRLGEWAQHQNLLDEVYTTQEVHCRITVYGREWFEELIGGGADSAHGPWWMRTDEPNQRWPKVGSRPVFDRDVEHAIEVAAAEKPVSLLFIDFDNLKKLNTEYTNTAADRSLGAVVDVIARVSEGRGRPYLYGNGDEFAILVPNTSTLEAVATAERICRECRALKIDGLPSPTVSIGVATYPDHATNANDFATAANTAQLEAKAQGKDRAVAAD